MIVSYNPQAVGDVLLIIVGNAEDQPVNSESKGNITRVYVQETNQTVGWNIFSASELFGELAGPGQVFLTSEQIEILNEAVATAGFTETVTIDNQPKIVTGFVKECVTHEDSDHLSVTQTEVGDGEVLQIVCGASNIAQGQTVVVAKPGAMMPDGLIIWPGQLRGVDSFGMICSGKELNLPAAQHTAGILVLPEGTPIGQAFPN